MGQDHSKPQIEATRTSLSVRDKNLTSFPYFIPERHPIESIDLASNRIKDLPTNLPYLHFLDYSGNDLNVISKNIELAILSYPSLSELHFSSNNLEKIPETFEMMSSLHYFYLDRNRISKFEIRIASLHNLDLSSNLLKNFSAISESLSTLNLNFNRLTQIEFMSSSLRELKLSGNDIASLPSHVHFESLTLLNISYNKLNSINNIGHIAPHLEKLIADFNFIDEFPPNLPHGIQYISLENNRLANLPPLNVYQSLSFLSVNDNCIQNLPQLPQSLKKLSLENNRIQSTASISLTSLQTLSIYNNNLQQVPHFTNSLITIFLGSFNKIHEINVNEFSQTITQIDLAGNNIEKLPKHLFMLPELKILNIYSNKISEMPIEISVSQLQILNISRNPISSLPKLPQTLGVLIAHDCLFKDFPNSVSSLSRIVSIDFSNNKIKSVPFLPHAETLILSCNEITEFPIILEYIRELDLSHNKIKAVNISHKHMYLNEINLSNNLLESYKCQVKLPALQTLKLNNNPKLNLHFSFENYPELDCLDISNTNIDINLSEPERDMREIIESSSYVLSPRTKIFKYNPKVGYAEMIGKRSTMEDALIIQSNIGLSLFAVIDGHAGSYTANMTAFKLPQMITKFDLNSIANSLKDLNNFLRFQNSIDGATLALVVQRGNKLIAANIGDSRSIIVRSNGSVFPLSYDHKPYERSELERIRRDGSYVEDMRTEGILAISRSLGDFAIKGVSAVPCINEYTIEEGDYRLLIACDGVFDVISNELAGKIIISEASPSVAAYKLRNAAYAMQSEDNISVIVVDLK